MRESIDLRFFDKGLHSDIDAQDIPMEAQTEGSYNLDVDDKGRLAGVPKSSLTTSYGDDGVRFGWIEGNDGKWDLIYTDGTGLYAITDFYGTPAKSTLATSYGADSIISNNREVHIGRFSSEIISAWVGYISHGQFGGSAPSGLQILDAKPAPPTSHTISSLTQHVATDDEDAKFIKGNMYEYRMSLVYDGYQESPLGGTTADIQISAFVDYITVTARIVGYSSLSERVTGVRVYRREKPFFDGTIYADYQEFLDFTSKLPYNLRPQRSKSFVNGMEEIRYTTGSLGEYGEFKLAKDIDINDTSWITSGSDKVFAFNDENDTGSTYTTNTGIPESEDEDDFSLSYALATTCNNMMFAANADHAKLPDDECAHMIFRSKPYRYDTFDWVNDKLIMPTIPTAMKSHRGKLYVWDNNTTYVINPNSFQIEKSITGRGCSSQESVVETDYGLFWANKNGVYWSTQTEELIKPTKDNLAEPIRNQYQTAVESVTPKLVYNSKRSQLLVHVGNNIFAYRPVEQRWDYYTPYSATINGAFTGKDGETYTTQDSYGIYEDFASALTNNWIFYSKEFTLDDPSQEAKFYKILRESSGAASFYYSSDSGSTWVLADNTQFALRAKSIRLKIIGLSYATVDWISIIYRKLRGKR